MKALCLILLFSSIAVGQQIPLNATIPVFFTTVDPTTGAPTNATGTPTCSMYAPGTSSAAYTANAVNVTTGLYRWSAVLSVANGFAVGTGYSTVCTAVVSGVTGYLPTQTVVRVMAAEGTTGLPATTVTTNNDKTAYALSGTQTFNNTGTWTGNVTGSIGSLATQAKADVQTEVSKGFVLKRATQRVWAMSFISAGSPVTGVTPTCTRSIDSVTAFQNTTNAASTTTSQGWSSITFSAADTTGSSYMALQCSAGGVTLRQLFSISVP
jgi:hypothetical protein